MEVNDPQVTEQIKQSREAVEAIEPGGVPPREIIFKGWTLPNGRALDEKRYVQDELGMYASEEFALLITEILDSFTEGEMGMKIGELFRGEVKMPDELTPEAVDKVVEENLALIKAFIKLVRTIPGLRQDITALSLGVPRRERDWFKDCINEAPHRGGLTVEEGFDILIVFIKQNALLVRETYLGKSQELVETFRLYILGEEETEASAKQESDAILASPSSPGGTPSSTGAAPMETA